MPFKAGGELLVYGTITPPNAHTRCVKLCIQMKTKEHTWQKALMVFGKRYWHKSLIGYRKSKADYLTPLTLGYQHAYGGIDPHDNKTSYANNPIGTGFTRKRFLLPNLALPQIEYAQTKRTSPRQQTTPAGFGPIAKQWQPRLDLFKNPTIHSPQTAAYPNAPAHLHNVAPLDQQFSKPFYGGEIICVTGFNADTPCHITIPKPPENLQAWDTVVIDMDKNQLNLIGRLGHVNHAFAQ